MAIRRRVGHRQARLFKSAKNAPAVKRRLSILHMVCQNGHLLAALKPSIVARDQPANDAAMHRLLHE
jgi:hypothetical protein